MTLTADVKSPWLNVIRRLQSVSCNQKGFAIVSIQILVDESGCPILWTEPSMVKLEPQSRGTKFLADLISGIRV